MTALLLDSIDDPDGKILCAQSHTKRGKQQQQQLNGSKHNVQKITTNVYSVLELTKLQAHLQTCAVPKLWLTYPFSFHQLRTRYTGTIYKTG